METEGFIGGTTREEPDHDESFKINKDGMFWTEIDE